MKLAIIAIILLIVIGTIIFLDNKNSSENSIWINNQQIKVELAETPSQKAQGLSGREQLCDNCGMFFLLEESQEHSFWMKEMKFDLDFIWINGNEVVGINENVSYLKGTEEKISPNVLADKVLEINAGKASGWGIEIGDEIFFILGKYVKIEK